MIDSGSVAADVPDSRRGSDRRTAICDAVCDLLAKVGYDRMTMDAIANRAKASKATIYRMWPDKPQLVVEALQCQFGNSTDVPDTGSLRGDLLSLLGTACYIADGETGEVMVGVLTAAGHDAQLAETLNQTLFKDKSELYAELVRRAVARGEVHAEADPSILHEVMHSMISGRKLWKFGPLDEEFARHMVDDILIPIVKHRQA